MTVPAARASVRAVDVLPGVGFALLYLVTLSRTLSVTHDGAAYFAAISRFEPRLLANHLLFEPIMSAAYRAIILLWPGLDAQIAIESVNAVAGAAAIQAAYAIAVWRMALARHQAALAAASAGLTYGVWYYSIAIETYSLPLMLVAWTFFGLTARPLRWGVVVACAVAHGVAMLCHQSAVLFGVVAVPALLLDDGPWQRRVGRLGLYGLICVLLVGGVYTTVLVRSGRDGDAGAAARWSLGHLTRRTFWVRPPRAFVHAAVGATRAMVGGQFMFADPEFAARAGRWFPRHDPVDERFFVRTVTPALARLLAAFALVALGSIAALVALAVLSLWRSRLRDVGREQGLLALWLATYCGFFTFWDPSNPDFWVVQVYLTPLLLMSLLARVGTRRTHATLFVALACSLLAVNGLGAVRLARDPGNDYYAVYLRSVARELKAGDLLVLGDHWPIRTHLVHVPNDTLFVSIEVARMSAETFARRVRQRLEAGSRVFLGPDVLEVSPVAIASYSRRYLAYVEELRNHVCGLAPPLGASDEMAMRQITCFDGRAQVLNGEGR